MGYCTAADVLLPTGQFSWPSGILDADKTQAIAEASELIDIVTKNIWDSRSLVLELSGDGTELLEFGERVTWNCLAVSEVLRRDEYGDLWTSAETIPANGYRITPSRKMLKRISANSIRGVISDSPIWLPGEANYRVTGTFGRTETPENIKRACVLIVREKTKPGSTDELVPMLSEQWADGYRYVRGGVNSAAASPPRLTGYTAADEILKNYVNKRPTMVVP